MYKNLLVVKLTLRGKKMSKKINKTYSDDDQYHVSRSLNFQNFKKRLNVSDLLRRAKEEEKSKKKFNLLIYSCVTAAVVVFLLITGI